MNPRDGTTLQQSGVLAPPSCFLRPCGFRLYGSGREFGIDRVRLSGRPRVWPAAGPGEPVGRSGTPVVADLLEHLVRLPASDLRCDRRIGYSPGGALDCQSQLGDRRERLRVERHLGETVRDLVVGSAREDGPMRVDDFPQLGVQAGQQPQ